MKHVVDNDFKGSIEFVAQNIATADFGDPVFKPYVIREINGVPVAIIGQAFPYTPIANPRYLIADWTFGIKERSCRSRWTRCARRARKIVVLLSHNGMDVDLKLATRVNGIDVILGGHTHDAVPKPVQVIKAGADDAGHQRRKQRKVPGGAGLRLWRRARPRVALPAAAGVLEPAAGGSGHGGAHRAAPRAFAGKLAEKLAVTEGLLYRRGNFNGTVDQLILDALMAVQEAPDRLLARVPLGHDPAAREIPSRWST